MKFVWQGKKLEKNQSTSRHKTKSKLWISRLVFTLQSLCSSLDKGVDSFRKWQLLKLEGHDLNLGWHAFLWYQKAKDKKQFKNHVIRNALNWVWTKLREENYQKVP